jgi:hypothetical protein
VCSRLLKGFGTKKLKDPKRGMKAEKDIFNEDNDAEKKKNGAFLNMVTGTNTIW